MKRWFLCILALCAGLTVRAQRLEELLPQLDAALAQADKYVAEKISTRPRRRLTSRRQPPVNSGTGSSSTRSC